MRSIEKPSWRPPLAKTSFVLGLLACAVLPAAAFAQDLEGNSHGTTPALSYPHSGVQLLRSFYFRFTNSDHHIRAVGIFPDDPGFGQAELIYSDENGDDPYAYHIQHQDVPFGSGIYTNTFGTEFCRGNCTFAIPRPAGNNVFVLRGFYFQFIGADHHMQQFEISENNGNLTVAFHDDDSSNSDDNYTFHVDYAYVPVSRFSSLGSTGGTASGAQGQPIPPGISVIRGFNFSFLSGDHHIDEMGMFQWGNGEVDAYWNDNNNDDRFSWSVDWAILN
jgi:hypothetical protein